MPENPEFVYPPDETDSRMTNRRFDAQERLIAWCVRQGDYFLMYRVPSFRDVRLADGTIHEVPAEIVCQTSDCELDPMSVPTDEDSLKRTTYDPAECLSREYDVDPSLRYNRARGFDPSAGKWISEDPLEFGACDADLYPYPDVSKVTAPPAEDSPSQPE